MTGRSCFCRVPLSRSQGPSADSVTLLAQDYHVMQVVYDGHGETGEDFVSVEATVDDVTDWLKNHGITELDAAYGCSLGGACLTYLLASGKIPVKRAVIDAGITPYQLPLILRRLDLPVRLRWIQARYEKPQSFRESISA